MNCKKLYIILIALGVYTGSYAQEIKLGLGLGYSHLLGDLTSFPNFNKAYGIAGYGEVGYGFNKHIDVSFLYQTGVINSNYYTDSQDANSFGIENIIVQYRSYLINSRYFFRKQGFNPYVSLGMGYSGNAMSNTILEGEENSGFSFRVGGGFKAGIFNMNIAYLKLPGVDDYGIADLTINMGVAYSFDISKSSITDDPEQDEGQALEENTNNISN